MNLIAVCPVHGPFPIPNFMGGTGSASVSFSNSKVSCPICGRYSPIPDGTYDFVGSAVRAFRAPGVTLESIEALRAIAQAEKDGTLSAKEAEVKAAEINHTFATLLKWANGNAAALGILIAMIALFIQIYSVHDSDLSSAQAHSDAQQQIRATQTELQMQQKIYEALQRQCVAVPSHEEGSRQMRSTQARPPIRKPAAESPNRHERRKTKAMVRRKPRS